MKKICLTSLGVAVGTLIYTRFRDNAHAYDWYRAAFCGVVTGVLMCVVAWSHKKDKQVDHS